MKADNFNSAPSKGPSPNTYLSNLNASVFCEIASILDANDTWKKLFTVLPESYYSAKDIFQFEREYMKSGSPSSCLLFDMGHKGFKVSHLITFLEKLQLERPLVYIKEFQPVRLTRPVQTMYRIQGGISSSLEMECPVAGFPRPEFQWFKLMDNGMMSVTWMELANECSSILCIHPVRLEDSGKYCCRFSNEDHHSNRVTCDFTDVLTVEVVQDVFEVNKDIDHFHVVQSPPEILRHPTCPSKGPFFQGSKLALECIAVGPEPITYEWFKNNKKIAGENGQVLNFSVQTEDDIVRFKYYCCVSNNYGSVRSEIVTISVAPPREGPQFLAEDKVALVIANREYDNHVHLRSAINDAATVAKLLKELDFKVLAAINLDLESMRNIVKEFCKLLDSGVYGVYYYAGHGFEVNKQCYMMPVDVPEGFSCARCICVDEIKACMQQRNPALCCLLLDTCRKDPMSTSEEVMKGFQVFQSKVDRNVICAYATSYTCSALDGPKDKNGMFVKHLRKYIARELSIEDVLNHVFEDISVDPAASKKQFPSISEKTLAQTRRSLTDKIHAMLPNCEDRNQLYSMLIRTPNNFTIRSNRESGNPVHIGLTFELQHEVVCNSLVMRLFVTDQGGRPLPAFTSYLESRHDTFMNDEANFEQVLVEGQNVVIVTFKNLQKLKDPLVLYGKLIHGQTEVDAWEISLAYPALSSVAHVWQTPTPYGKHLSNAEDDESGIGSFTSRFEN